MVIRHNWVSR